MVSVDSIASCPHCIFIKSLSWFLAKEDFFPILTLSSSLWIQYALSLQWFSYTYCCFFTFISVFHIHLCFFTFTAISSLFRMAKVFVSSLVLNICWAFNHRSDDAALLAAKYWSSFKLLLLFFKHVYFMCVLTTLSFYKQYRNM